MIPKCKCHLSPLARAPKLSIALVTILLGSSVLVKADTTSTISANFNGTPIAAGNNIWFNSVLKPSGLGTKAVTIFVRNSTIQFTASGTNFNLPVPDANITFDPAAQSATTSFSVADNAWRTTVPSSGLAGNTFLDALRFLVPQGGLPGGIQNVTWTAGFSSDTSGISLNWQWGAAVYTSFSTDYNALGVKPVDDNQASQYQNSDHAGTPENFKSFVTGGATGGGGANFTGSLSATLAVAPTLVFPPVISDFNPKSAPVGTVVNVTGNNFISATGTGPQVTLAKQGGGSILAPVASFTATSISFVIPTGASSGPLTVVVGSLRAISATSLTVVPASTFTLSATPSTANLIQGQSVSYAVTLTSTNGFSQLAALSVSGLPAGVTAKFTPSQITAGETSTFTVTAPSNQPTGAASLTVSASATVGGISQTQSAAVTLNIQPVSMTFLGRTVVQDVTETPLAGVTITMLGVDGNGTPTGCTGQTRSDAAGNFAITNLPTSCIGSQLIRYDGTTVTSPPGTYAGVDLLYTFVSGQVTTPPFVIHLPRIDNAETVMVQQNAPTDQTFTFRTIPRLSVTVYAGTIFTLVNGTRPNPFPFTAVQVPVDRLPDQMPMTTSTVGAFIVAFQPANSTASQPVAVTFPNTLNTPPGVNMELDTLDPTKGVMVKYGTGTVSSDATQIVPDLDPAFPGHRFGLVHFDWHGPMAPAPNIVNPTADRNSPRAGDPVDPATGLLVVEKTDIAFGGARGQIAIVRTYRTLSGTAGPFGVGTNHNYGYLLDVSNFVRGTAPIVNLVTPDGNQFTFTRQPNGTFTNSRIPSLLGAIITNPSSATYTLTWKNGTVYQFQGPSQNALVAFLNAITDRNGNTVTLIRGNTSQPAQITQIVDPVGRALSLNYDGFNRITALTDPIGRTVQYTYNAQGTLATVTDPASGVTSYTYDSQNRLTQITDPRGIIFLQDTYDSNGRVVQQVAADGGVTTFAYTLLNPLVSTSPVLLTTVTDPLGHQTINHFNPQGFLLDLTDALGQKTTYTRDPGTNLLLSTTDLLNRTTAFTYDSAGNVTTITRLAGTPSALTTSFTNDLVFNHVTSITDPLNDTTRFIYGSGGNLISVTDALNDRTILTYDAAGELVTTSDPLGNTTQLAYDGFGNVTQITDALGRITAMSSDTIGRVVSIASPLGQTTQLQYDALNQLTQVTDSAGGKTSFSHDPNGNLLSVTDALGHATTYAYDRMDRLGTRTDPLGRTESYQYDLGGNLVRLTDRRGKVTSYVYDALNRRTFAGFATQAGPTFESTISYTYDAASRLVQAVDSVTGTVIWTFDGLDRLASEVSPQGVVGYTYDAGGRRTGLTVAGQPAVSYSFDNANRLTQVTQGTSNVSFTYDTANRRTTLVLPNGVTASYSYDAASQLTGITYRLGSTVLGNLTYTYDNAGKRTSGGGSFARTALPTAVTNTAYNADNQLTQFGTTSLTYDANGNLISDGVNTYTWDARNHLISITSGSTTIATFQYDALGRRVAKTVSGATAGFLYDGVKIVQELSSGIPTANLLTAFGVDEVFARVDSSGTRHFITDALGSVIALADPTGAIQTQYLYEPFGNTTATGSPSSSPYQYTGRENDRTGLYYYRARYYSSTLQRFISEDPVGFLSGANLYGYVGQSPTNFVDPSGTLAARHHFDLTYQAALSAGWDPEAAALLGRAVVNVDNLPGSQGADAKSANMHSMSGRKPNGSYQSCEQASTAAQDLFEQEIESGSMADIAKALHMIQDAYSPAHAGFQRWDGGTTYFIPLAETAEGLSIEHVPSLGHGLRDEAAGAQALHDAFVNSQRLLRDLRERSSALNNPANYFPPSPCGPQ